MPKMEGSQNAKIKSRTPDSLRVSDILLNVAINWFKLCQLYRQMSRPSQGCIIILIFLLAFQIPTRSKMSSRGQLFEDSDSAEFGSEQNEAYLPKIPFLKFYPNEMADGWESPQPKAVCTNTRSRLSLHDYCPGNSDLYEITCVNKGLDETQGVLWKCKMDIVPVQEYVLHKSTVICLQSELGKGHVVKNSCKVVFSTNSGETPASILNYSIVAVALSLFFFYALQLQRELLQVEPILEMSSSTNTTYLRHSDKGATATTPSKKAKKKDIKVLCSLFECLFALVLILRMIVFLQEEEEDPTKTYIFS